VADDVVVLDTGCFWSFAVVGLLDALGQSFGRSIRWTETVQNEVRRNTARAFELHDVLSAPWLGPPIRLEGAAAQDALALRSRLAKPSDPPLMHLGEAESIVAALSLGCSFAAEDNEARRQAMRIGVPFLQTHDLLRACVENGVIECADAVAAYEGMMRAGRSLPKVHLSKICGTPT
jgi:predicted nucleic acid-binding protein